MINVRGTRLWFNFRHDRQIPPNLSTKPVRRSTLIDLLEAHIGYGRLAGLSTPDLLRGTERILERVEAEHERVSHITTCRVSIDHNGIADPIFETLAYCSRGDNFSRQTGRWYTVARAVDALREFKATEDIVERFLSAYFGRYAVPGLHSAYLPYAQDKAFEERQAYIEWLNTTYKEHQAVEKDPYAAAPAAAPIRPDVCPLCETAVIFDRWPIAEAPFDGSPTETQPVPVIYHRACYVAAHPPAPEAIQPIKKAGHTPFSELRKVTR